MAFGSTSTQSFGYNPRNELTSASRNGMTWSYDPIGNRLTSQQALQQATTYRTNELNQYLLLDNAYGVKPLMTYDADGNLSELSDLIKADMNCDGSVGFEDIDPFNRAVSSQQDYEAAYPYCEWLNGDLNGDLTVDFQDVDYFVEHIGDYGVRRVHTWDAENRLIRYGPVPGHEQAGDKKVEFTYDYLGRRVEKKVYNWVSGQWQTTPALDRKFVWSGWLMLLELNGLSEDAVVRQYTWGLDLAGQTGAQSGAQSGAPTSGRSMLEGAGGIGGLLAVLDTNGTPGNPGDDKPYVYFYNGNGDVGQVIDPLATTAGGSIKVKFEYDPYGARVNIPLVGEFNQPFRFSTKYFDAESGLYDYGYRYYHPGLGRWISRDPLEEADHANLTVFVGNDGVNSIDPYGLFKPWIHRDITAEALKRAGCAIPDIGLDSWVAEVDTAHPFDPRYHAQNFGFVTLVKDSLDELKKLDCCKYGFFSAPQVAFARLLGIVGHILQDFYSHSDWIEGGSTPMLRLYRRHGYAYLIPVCKGHVQHTGVLSIELLADGSYDQLHNVTLYPGMGYPGETSEHNAFNADEDGSGRARAPMDGLGYHAFDRAKDFAIRQTVALIEWMKTNTNKCYCKWICQTGCTGGHK